ncbi:MAG: type II toxin-antitoxin system HicB family antitoxin [Magnetococcales bacterium]|nr:type II toxin-antitoxin system HicB family antitoxin [Magnetococcales bacterium]
MTQPAEPVRRLNDPDFRRAEAALHRAAAKAQQQAREAGLEPIILRGDPWVTPSVQEKYKPRQVILRPGEDGFWLAECPSLPGCISQGETREAAIASIQEAILAHVAALRARGLPVPDERFETTIIAV